MAHPRDHLRRPGVWQALHSLFAGSDQRAGTPRVPIVALILSEQDRSVLTSVSRQEQLDVHFAESCEEAATLAKQLNAPVVFFDRNWPGTDWRTAVEGLTASLHHACVILMSGVTDEYLWQELIRRGGYDVLAKPIRAESAARVIKLALSYLRSAGKTGSLARRS